jgi:putative hydrolase of the HAD superfamily
VEKPDPRIFRRALERLGAEPSEALHVGDSPEHDLAGARAVGIAALLVDRRGAPAPHVLAGLGTLPHLAAAGLPVDGSWA